MRKENIGNWICKEWIWVNHGNIMKSLYRYDGLALGTI
jgi:hypothetical protein